MTNHLIVGASRGLGFALTKTLSRQGHTVWAVARSQPDYDNAGVHWIKADLTESWSYSHVKEALGGTPLSSLIYVAGIWEQSEFSYLTDDEIVRIINTNVTSLLLITRAMIENLVMSREGRIVIIGSTSGLENEGSTSVVYTTSKFAVRGAAHSLREYLRPRRIPVCCLSPGSTATDIDIDEGVESALSRFSGARIPMQDVIDIIGCVLKMSPAACVKEIHMPAVSDDDV